MRLPSGLTHTLVTLSECPWSVSCFCPVRASHTRTVSSQLPDTMRLPSGPKHTLLIQLACPLRESCSCPVCASHTFTAWSSPPRYEVLAVGRAGHTGDEVGVSPE